MEARCRSHEGPRKLRTRLVTAQWSQLGGHEHCNLATSELSCKKLQTITNSETFVSLPNKDLLPPISIKNKLETKTAPTSKEGTFLPMFFFKRTRRSVVQHDKILWSNSSHQRACGTFSHRTICYSSSPCVWDKVYFRNSAGVLHVCPLHYNYNKWPLSGSLPPSICISSSSISPKSRPSQGRERLKKWGEKRGSKGIKVT